MPPLLSHPFSIFSENETGIMKELIKVTNSCGNGNILRIHRHRDRVRPGQPLKPLVWTIARNLARNRLRAERLWGWLPLAVLNTLWSS